MAYAGGYAGGYADTIVPPTPTPEPGGGGYQYLPAARPTQKRRGRAKIRLRVTLVTWGAEAHQTIHHTLAVAALTSGTGETRATTLIDGDIHLRHGSATSRTRAELGTHIGDPREDDRFVALCLAALLEDETP